MVIDDVMVASEKNTLGKNFDMVNVYLGSPNESSYGGSIKDLKITDNF